jgi:predicted nucleic acid-binding Zn ribbon protein|tara:strand:+ start:1128 stop:1277 length:150 start_codon:yes stop_codon:yes gene_type:complete
LVSGGSGLIFKGSGFYLTDYAKKPKSEKKIEPKNDKPSSKTIKKESKKT